MIISIKKAISNFFVNKYEIDESEYDSAYYYNSDDEDF